MFTLLAYLLANFIGHLGHFFLEFFGHILDTRDNKTYPRTYPGHFMLPFRWFKFTP